MLYNPTEQFRVIYGCQVAEEPACGTVARVQFIGTSKRSTLCNSLTWPPVGRQFEASKTFHLTKKCGGLHLERPTNVKNTSKRRICFSQLDEANESTLVAGHCSESILAHLLPQPMFPQQLTERYGRIEFCSRTFRRCHTSMWHRKYITRCL